MTSETRALERRRRFHVFVNEAAGSVDDIAAESAQIEEAFAGAGVDVTVAAVDPADLAAEIRSAWTRGGVDAIVVAGGDGTINCAAGAAVSSGAVLGVLPMGTFNHFAKDLGMPTDLNEAVTYLAGAPAKAVDVGEVNGRVFVNNATLGVYPEMVEQRDLIRKRRGWGKLRAVPAAVLRTLRRMPTHRLRISLDDEAHLAVTTPFLFVGNGLFDQDGVGVGTRSSLTGSRLGIYVIATSSRWRLIRDALRARIGGIDSARQTERRVAESVLVESDDRSVALALDGEPLMFDAPLRFRIRPGALRVLRVPGPSDADAVPTVAR